MTRTPTTGIALDELEQSMGDCLARVRGTAPVAWVPALDGWMVTNREVAIAVMGDPVTFTVDDPRFSTARVVGPSMLSLDGVEHRRHRGPFGHAFRPAEASRRHEAAIEAGAGRIVSSLQPTGHAELRRELAGPLAVEVVARALGLEQVEPSQLLAWYDQIVATVEQVSRGGPVDEQATEAFGALGRAVMSAAARTDSVLHVAASTLSPTEIVANAAVFMFGGIETSEGMTANLLVHLLSHPAQLERLRQDRGLLDGAVEESLRLEPAAARVDRYATADVRLAGAEVRRGDLVVVSLTAANRDPEVFEHPDEFDITRPNARSHVSFAHGPHACLGAQLARMETRAAAAAVLDLLPGIELTTVPSVGGIVFRKPTTVPVRWPVLQR